MTLVRATLKTEIRAMLDDFPDGITADQAKENFSEKLSLAIDNYIRSGTVVTAGSSTTQTGAMT